MVQAASASLTDRAMTLLSTYHAEVMVESMRRELLSMVSLQKKKGVRNVVFTAYLGTILRFIKILTKNSLHE